ncbi:MAG: hypothetical protein LKE64_07740 [Solobacterium sp.]|nr:hypothetical protein [Solobacterium sp.]MCH4048876.1 hypothetical protein [Solobacterium sp.]MCH4074370.1 hypothetical protein [Solobacterium sp.]MCI1313947.1 hypothetical protein [Solobacterium sp.]MCI1346054.1 hypothetical protein [Solobacterium sp.]
MFFPGNNWFHYEGSRKCSLYRNSVFLVSGITIILILLGTHSSYGVHMSIAIAASFACCLPVNIWAKKIPAIGSLMMPRTMAYAVMIIMGLKMLNEVINSTGVQCFFQPGYVSRETGRDNAIIRTFEEEIWQRNTRR